ncbi:acylneuraminate cytidylyltransferase family protein [Butyrivibrio sp. TB]|uniref:acylneuraminate cytidylyltransferase family protein n=1 Tax=Butyrivibrio sp. TB TaxID=1520809 RepID=UPI0008D893F1|nr:acylneuraminate cytidylyltransferase family protein [Butyrivibrio sp. TB]SEQ15702.1 CMP-N,N'-diacetyllegionaminic acid synthase [Butyrivibrio sp. TB]
MKNIAIIPARSGSKGLPDKNIKMLSGKPLIAWSIEAAISSGVYDEVMVSTDSEKYADIARSFGAKVPFLRSAEASSDTSSSWDAVREVILKYQELGQNFDTFTLLQPTSPLRSADDIKGSFDQMLDKNARTIVSVCETEDSPYTCNTLPESMSMQDFFIEEYKNTRRQDLPKCYRLNGAIYLSKVDEFLKDGDIYASDCYAYIMDGTRSVDIDTDFDFKIAQLLIEEGILG